MTSIDSVEWSRISDVIGLLSDGAYHSGEELGDHLSISRAGVWKYIKKIEQLGVGIESVKGKGYKLNKSISLLSAEKILPLIGFPLTENIQSLDVFPAINSTNSFLLSHQNIQGKVCLAELQTSGRGRRGREWISPFAKNIYLSIGWRFESGISAVKGLSLAVGVTIAKVLEAYRAENIFLKWPNDLVVKNNDESEYKKLAGILIELRGDVSGDCELIIGVGLNYDMGTDAELIDQPWIDLGQVLAKNKLDLPSRNELAANLIRNILSLLAGYERQTFAAYRQQWELLNVHDQQQVSVSFGADFIDGVFSGLDDDGALILKLKTGESILLNGGEISIRKPA